MSRSLASRVVAVAAVAIGVAACGGDHSSAPSSRCGTSSLTSVTWVGAGWVGAGVPAVVAIGYYGGWYDPVDSYDPALDDGTDTTIEDPTGSGDTTPVEVPGSDDVGGATDFGDTSDESGSSDFGDDSGGDFSTESVKPLDTAVVNGCYTCTIGCLAAGADGGQAQTGRQSLGVSASSHDDACRNAVQSLAMWSHRTLHQRLGSCEQVDQATTGHVPATPSVAPR